MLQSRGVVGVKSLPTVSYLIDYGLTECRGIIMIVKKLRDKNDWSQEQLAEYSGLNVRTIQRVESGQKASIETLKCLASVFEVNISKLTEEITVIDKEAEKWKKLPWWFRANMFGVNSRRHVQVMEFTLLTIAFGSWFLKPEIITTPTCFLAAYLTGWIIRFGDKTDAW
jgi:transcriptional regulator with XRE-family HTH domain